METPATKRIEELQASREAWQDPIMPWAYGNPEEAGELRWLLGLVETIRHEDHDLDDEWLENATGDDIEEQLVYLSDYQG